MPSYRSIECCDVADGHPVDVFDKYWRAVSADGKPVPWRCFRPMDFPKILPWVLLLDYIDDETYVYRLTGTGCEQIFDRNLSGEVFGTGVKKSFIMSTLQEFHALRAGKGPFYQHGTVPIKDREYIEVYRASYGFADKTGDITKMLVIVAPVSKIVEPSMAAMPARRGSDQEATHQLAG